MKRKLYHLGGFLVDQLKLDHQGRGRQELRQELEALSVGTHSAVKSYYIQKLVILMIVLAAGLVLSLVCLVVYRAGGGPETLETLPRPGYGEGDRREALAVQIEGETDLQELEVTVQERRYTDQEKSALLNKALEELELLLPGDNESLDYVQTSLAFPTDLADGAVSVAWATVPYGVINEDGSIKSAENEEGTLVQIQATLNCGGQEAAYTAYANVFPPQRTPQEELLYALRKEVELADAEAVYESELALPSSVAGKKVLWMKGSGNPFGSMLAATLALAACIYLQMDNQVHKRAEERKRQLLLGYPDLMWKMTMLLGAGMSIRSAFFRISEEYRREKEKKSESMHRSFWRKQRPEYMYEEISFTCREMQSGIGEAQAYERFGKRCQLPEYIRIGSVLSQNLKKGAKGLTELLESEAETSLRDRKNQARKLGEQAGTKLLLPMILMLVVVLTVLMAPAFLAL